MYHGSHSSWQNLYHPLSAQLMLECVFQTDSLLLSTCFLTIAQFVKNGHIANYSSPLSVYGEGRLGPLIWVLYLNDIQATLIVNVKHSSLPNISRSFLYFCLLLNKASFEWDFYHFFYELRDYRSQSRSNGRLDVIFHQCFYL